VADAAVDLVAVGILIVVLPVAGIGAIFGS
jgi:hypothetical protein